MRDKKRKGATDNGSPRILLDARESVPTQEAVRLKPWSVSSGSVDSRCTENHPPPSWPNAGALSVNWLGEL